MKAQIHPNYNEITVSCACGNSFQTGSTKGSFHVDVCSKCHPFFTGEQRLLDTKGSVEKFIKKQAMAKEYKAKMAEKKSNKNQKEAKQALSLRELLGQN